MRILLISAAFPPSLGGVSTHVGSLAYRLSEKRGFFVNVLTSGENNCPPFGRKDNSLVWEIKKRRIPNFYGRRAPFEDILTFIMDNWHKINADLIHAHDFDSIYIGWMLKIAFKLPLLVTVHRAPSEWIKGIYKESPKDCFMEAVKLFGMADYIIVPSKTSYDALKAQGFKARGIPKIAVIPHGISYKYLSGFASIPSIIEELKLNKDDLLILCPIRADEHKNPDVFIRAASHIKRKNRDRKILFLLTDELDPSSDYRDLPDKANAHGLEINKDIYFKRYKNKEMPTLYRRANVCVVPSIRESFGLSVLEAFLFKSPVIASSALSEIVIHEQNGLLFRSGSHTELARQVQKVIDDQNLAYKIRERGFSDVVEYYNIERMTKDYHRLYKRATERK